MSSGSTVLQASEKESGGNKRTSCPYPGCKRVYTDTGPLDRHIQDHEIPAQSLPGKILLCSTVGCSGSFPNMQKLMEHMRHHHKPNIFYLCESCRTKLRSYRGLLTHLHTCSKVPRGKTKPAEQTAPQLATVINPNMVSISMDQKPQWKDSMSTPLQPSSQIQNQEGSFHIAVPEPDSAVHPLLSPPFSSHQDPRPPQLHTEAVPQSLLKDGAFNVPLTLNMDGPSAAPDLSEAQGQNQTQSRSPEPIHHAPVSTPYSPPGSSAIWKKNQGRVCNRRILWEHTKGCYTCVQCGVTSFNRKDMTQHINDQHSGNNHAEDSGSSANNT
ncbi:zinc finger protein 414 isoform X1 [Pleuronectes platessa]|uniref:zinc finger protein 414 isoform X1 n=1 Tax=Pleuronectes platessa TaxID=8262 RepID=UPI00232A4E0F|nr:zinc finger protein 414 isoform X1 [Pleuronectes platessa]